MRMLLKNLFRSIVGCNKSKDWDLFEIREQKLRTVPFKLRHNDTDQERLVERDEWEEYLDSPEDLIVKGARPFFAEVRLGDEVFEVCSGVEANLRLAMYHGFEIRRNGRLIKSWRVCGN